MKEDEYNDLASLTYPQLADHLVKFFNIPLTGAQYFEKRQEKFFSTCVPGFKETPGALKLLQQLVENGIKCGIASASSMATFECFFQNNPEYRQYITSVVSCDDVGVSKPDPTVYKECIRRLECKESESVIFEDSFVGLTGAKKVCKTCCVLSGTDKEKQKRELADLVIKDFYDLLK